MPLLRVASCSVRKARSPYIVASCYGRSFVVSTRSAEDRLSSRQLKTFETDGPVRGPVIDLVAVAVVRVGSPGPFRKPRGV